jgi:Domain of Unknown Function (DUF1080)
MKSTLLLIFSCIGLLAFNSPKKERWVKLFNGKDLKNWTVKIHHHEVGDNYGETFRVKDGVIQVRYDQYDHFNERYGHLFFNKAFSNYRLRLEYRFTGIWRKDAPNYTEINSGIMFHSQDPKTILKEQDWPISVEMQFLGGLADGKPRPTGNMCSPGTDIVYQGRVDPRHCINSSSKTFTGDQWIQAELVVLGDSIVSHYINGEKVLEYTKPQIGGGTANRFDPAIKIDGKPLKSGFIALQSEGQEIDFRNIEIVELKPAKNR